MKVALVNPNWSFDRSIYFGCREPHLPIEYGYARALLEQAGHEVSLIDGQMFDLAADAIRERVRSFGADLVVVTTAPSYLFWRCAPPELRVPQALLRELRGCAESLVAVGPHGSTTPRVALRKLGVDAAVLGECEEVLVKLCDTPRTSWNELSSIAWVDHGELRVQGRPHASNMAALPALRWSDQTLRTHHHHHHRFDLEPQGPGAELEASRGCPFSCTFCAKENFRNGFRRRPLDTVLRELDAMIAQGVEYVYFVDEIFMPDRPLLEALVRRPVRFGVQMRIDLWTPELLDLVGEAGCVSIEAGLESVTLEGRAQLGKRCKLSTEQMAALLVHAKRKVAFVQANLINASTDDPAQVAHWRDYLRSHGIWANDPVPLFPYPGSPDYTLRWGPPDDLAWERAHEHYLKLHESFSELQDARPASLNELEEPVAA